MRYGKFLWVGHILWWLVSTFYLRYPHTKFFQERPNTLIWYLIVSFFLGLTGTTVYTIVFKRFNKDEPRQTFLFPILGSMVVGALFFIQDGLTGFMRYGNPSRGIPPEWSDYIQYYVESVRYVALWFLLYHLLLYSRIARERDQLLTQTRVLLQNAQLEILRNQLNPHFLFNAINSIKALTISDQELARKGLTNLSQLLRTSLSMGSYPVVEFIDELKLVRDYLSLEKIRYEERITYSLDIQRAVLRQNIPPMTLQLLVENAIKHGIGKNKKGGIIHISAKYNNGVFELIVKNSGKLVKEEKKRSNSGVGLLNLEKRLLINFPDKAEFILKEEDEFVVASIIIRP
ncbi:Histidine kinase [Pseudarcicella hirudinis]|uniref:Histidine kinase n=1 Tax=Pseudarcicella hirudinis TaxID=1079859 RepID=A0A1I5UUV3_9BACT|nr:histidine kinase [Pseudarcicella hirudinis]SFP99035.1 Histidine kinase [Pseudarcicella hirudinis]